MSDNNKILHYLKDLSDYKVASGYPDVRDWPVIDAEGKNIGKVTGLLSNVNTERVAYLDMEVNEKVIEDGHQVYSQPAGEGAHEILNEEGENHLIIPIGMVKLDEENKKVVSDEVDYAKLSTAKRFKGGEDIDQAYEVTLFCHLTGDKTLEVKEITDEFYERPEFNTITRRTEKM